MSASPDFMTQLLWGNQPLQMNNGLYNPTMGLALGLLQAGGPSRMPVSLGQALGQGFQTGQQFQGAGLQNAMQQLMLGRQQAYVNALMKGPPGSDGSGQPQATPSPQGGFPVTPTSMALDALSSGRATPDQAMQMSQTPLEQLQKATPNGNVAPVSQQDADNLGTTIDNPLLNDPRISQPLWYARMAAIGNDPKGQESWTNQARLQYDILSNSPAYKAAVSRATFMNTPQDLRQGGAIFDPYTHTWMAQNPRLPTGATLDSSGNVSLVPGATDAIFGSDQASARAGLYGKPAEGVITSGPFTGAKYQSTVGDLTNGGRGAGGITALPPTQAASMKTYGEKNPSVAEQWGNEAETAQNANLQYEAMLGALGNLNTYSWKPEVGKLEGAINSLDPKHSIFSGDLGNLQEFNKMGGQAVLAQSKTMGSRVAAQEVQMIQDWNANPKLQPVANYAIIQYAQGQNDWKIMKNQAFANWMQQNPNSNYQAFQSRYQQIADPAIFALKRMTDPNTNQFTPAGKALINQIAPTKQALQALMARKQMMQKYGWYDLGNTDGQP